MARDLSKLKAAKQALENKGGSSFKRLKINKEVEVRVLPYKDDRDMPFFESHQFFGWEKYPITAPRTYGKPDPAQDLSRELWEAGDKDTARKLFPTRNYSCWVLEVGKESEGPKLWSMSKSLYESLLNIFLDVDEYGDVLDAKEGRNFKITRADPAPGQDYGKLSVAPKIKTSEVKDYEEQINKEADWKEVFQEADPALIIKHLDRIVGSSPEKVQEKSNVEEDSDFSDLSDAI